MERRRLASSDRYLSVLGYGAWVTGSDTATRSLDAPALERAIDAAIESGMNWIDTAEIYASGLSERVVGRAIRQRRDRVLLATKVAPAGAGSGMRPEEIGRALRASLSRLQTDRVDLYLLHWYDPTVPLEETWGAMRGLVDEGLAHCVGVSNFGTELVERCLDVGPVDAVQNQLSMLHRDDVASSIGWLRTRGISYIAYGSLAFGLLSGGITTETVFDRNDWRTGELVRYEENYYRELFEPGRRKRHLALIAVLRDLADEIALPLPLLALRWVLRIPGVTSAVVGSLRPEHIRANARAGDLHVDPDALRTIDGLVRGHDGLAEP
ncbi:MAG TPA: aldo/keto reductase [Actinomycetota bacterium]|nr:aldo/keto reductase [Actinomycetota bacterium]